MKFRLSTTFVVFAAALWTLLSQPVRTQSSTSRVSDTDEFQGRSVAAHEVLVRVRAGAPTGPLHSLIDAVDDRPIGSQGWHRIKSSSRLVGELITRLKGRFDVLDIEPNYIVRAINTPNDPFFSSLWAMLNTAHPGADIHATSAWNVSTGSAANVIGVVDTGVDYTHPDLAGNMWSAPTAFTVTVGAAPGVQGRAITCPAGSHGFNAILFTCDPMDDNFHGTHVSGTIGAVGNNSTGVVGVNWTTRIMALKFLDSTGSGTTADAVNAIDFAVQTKAAFSATGAANVRVLSNSWGGGGASNSLSQEIAAANAAEMLFVAAAGNSANNNDVGPFFPASYALPNVVAVAATTETDGLATFSNYGPMTVHLGAPGTNIFSTFLGGGYGGASGTSMATPHVAGAAMLVLSACNLSTKDLKSAILNNVDALASLSGLVVTGGRLNVDRAIRSCATIPTVSLTSPPDGAMYSAPATIPLAADALDPDGISRVEFYQGTTLIGTSSTAPFGGTWSNVGAGAYSLTAKAYDTFGVAGVSTPVLVSVSGASSATANFVGVDQTTQGGWQGLYGRDGYNVVGSGVSYPPYAGVTPSGQQTFVWAGSTADVRALQKSNGPDRIAATWYANTFSVDVNLTDGAPHTLSLYVLDWDTSSRAETIEVHDATTNALLDSRAASAFHGGQYWRWNVSGHVTFRINRTSGSNAVLGGLFFDPIVTNPPPIVTLTGPTEGATFTAPANVGLAAVASDADGIDHVDFYQGSSLIATSTNGLGDGTRAYTATWSGATAGSYTLTAKAFDTKGATNTSAGVHVTVNPAAGGTSASFLSTDTTTQGSWMGVYGRDGYNVINNAVSYPAYASVTPAGQASWTWTPSTLDVRGLQKPGGTDRLASSWYGSTFSVDINLTDGATHTLSLYIVDWDTTTRNETLEVRDAATNAVLDSRAATSFNGGQYWRWNIRGHVLVRLVGTKGPNAVLSGIFFDSPTGNTPPSVALISPADGATFTSPASINLSASASDADGINRVDFYQGTTLVATSNNGTPDGATPYTASWSGAGLGSYVVTAKAYDTLGASSTSGAAHVTVTGAGGSATFVATDTTSQGTWQGLYGKDGYNVIGSAVAYPAYVTVTPTGQSSWTWAASTSDVRGLQKPGGSDRIASTWYGRNSFTIDVNITDGAAHTLSLYVIDWDTTTRSQTIEIRDASTNALLDTRAVTNFHGGQYWRWTVGGHLVVRIVQTGTANAVVSGLFFD